MSQERTSDLPAAAGVQATDLLDVSVDNGNSTYTSKKVTAANFMASSALLTGQVNFWMNGGGSSPSVGIKNWVQMPYAGAFTGWVINADTTGSAVVVINKSTSYPTFSAISGSQPPTLSTQQSNSNLSLSGWTTSFNAGDYIQASVTSASTVTKILVTLNTQRNTAP